MKFNPNCSEAIYRLKSRTIKKFSSEQMDIFEDVIEILATKGCEIPIYLDGEDFEYRPYFEKILLDLFLDYFGVEEAERNHWTCDASSNMTKENYEKAMKMFCQRYDLLYKKDCYERRYIR